MKLIITIAAVPPETPRSPGAYAAVYCSTCNGGQKDPAYFLAKSALLHTTPEKPRRNMAHLTANQIILPLTSSNENARVIVRTEDHDTAVAVLDLTRLKAPCQTSAHCGDLSDDHDLKLATEHAQDALRAALLSGVEFNSIARPEQE